MTAKLEESSYNKVHINNRYYFIVDVMMGHFIKLDKLINKD